MPPIRPALAAAAVVAALAPTAPPAAAARPAAACPGADLVPNRQDLALVRRATLCLLNRERLAHRLHVLRSNRRLGHAAVSYSRSMVGHGFFAHVSAVNGSTLESRLHANRYLRDDRAWEVGENIAWGSGSYATPRSIVSEWMHSPGHRANILTGRFRDTGLGIVLGAPDRSVAGQPAATYTTDFGWES